MRPLLVVASFVLAPSLLAPSVLPGCTCSGGRSEATPSPVSSASSDAETPVYDLHFTRTALIAFGNTTPLPISAEFNEPIPALGPPLERASKMRPGQPLRARVERDVHYGQLTRAMQAAIGYRVASWEISTPSNGSDASGRLTSIELLPPGAMPRGNCWLTAWVGPDLRVQVGIETKGIVVPAREGKLAVDLVLSVLRRLDERCTDGQARLLSQPTAGWGPVFDLARSIVSSTPRPHVTKKLELSVPSLGPLDSTVEFVK